MSEQRFWGNVIVAAPTQCWPWKLWRDRKGYGYVTVNGRSTGSHRRAWELAYGPIPAGLMVLHRCDNPPCCNPDHLFLGTAADNSADMKSKGRGPLGDRNGSRLHPERLRRGANVHFARLTESQVGEIRTRWFAGALQSVLANEFNVSQSDISFIVRGQTWKTVPRLDLTARTVSDWRIGSTNPNARLDETMVWEIRYRVLTLHESKESVARRYSVTGVLIGKIVRRELWAHVA